MKIIVSGGTGFLGARLIPFLLQHQHEVIALTRSVEPARVQLPAEVTVVSWGAPQVWEPIVNGVDAIINLSGESIVGGRWTTHRKKRLLSSRTRTVRAIRDAITRAVKKPRLLVNASAVGYYGDVREGDVTEEHPAGTGFLSDLCVQWEQEVRAVGDLGVRVAMLRTGLVLGRGGGALEKLLLPVRLFVGGWLGSGAQNFPWIHIDDVAGSILFALENENFAGPVNLVAPEAVTMKSFCRALAKAANRPCWAPVPAPIVRIALGEMADMLLSGARIVPAKLLDMGYRFKFPSLKSALADLLP